MRVGGFLSCGFWDVQARAKRMSQIAPRLGWMFYHEQAPSLCQHFAPLHGHEMTNVCWCKPRIETEPRHTLVIHNG